MLVQEIVCKNVLGVHFYKAHNKTPNSFSAGFLVHFSSQRFSHLRMHRSVDKKKQWIPVAFYRVVRG